jgi:hypothetical protein
LSVLSARAWSSIKLRQRLKVSYAWLLTCPKGIFVSVIFNNKYSNITAHIRLLKRLFSCPLLIRSSNIEVILLIADVWIIFPGDSEAFFNNSAAPLPLKSTKYFTSLLLLIG